MDLPRAQILKQLRLTLSAEGRRIAYFLSDLSNGMIVSVPRETAAALHDMKGKLDGAEPGQTPPDRTMLETGVRAIGYVKSLRQLDRAKASRFNPLFIPIRLFDVGRWQPALVPFARWFVGWPALVLVAALSLFAFTLGVRNDWAIRSEFSGLLSLEALLAFGLIAPFLKIVHEFGHVLVATAVGVRVRDAAVTLIGFYPLPSVDCSEADVSASRRDRVLISLAGILTDFLVGLIAFTAWHFLEGDRLQGMAGRILAFSTMNSLLFNANPLMKFDGYYAVVDLIGQRNLYTRAAQQFALLRRWIMSIGAAGARPDYLGGWAVAGYGFATFLYRLVVMFKILSGVLPQYLGAGLIVGGWGAYLMFVSPILADPAPKQAETVPHWRIWLGRLGFGLALAVVIAFLRLPFVHVLDLRLDETGHYAVTAQGTGFVETGPPLSDTVDPGQHLLTLGNPELLRKAGLLQMELAEAALLMANTQSVGAAQSQMARERHQSVTTQFEVLEHERAALTTFATTSGIYVSAGVPRPGTFITGGSVIGHLFPDSGEAVLIGRYPERWVEAFQTQSPTGELRMGSEFLELPEGSLTLIEGTTTDPVTGLRSITLVAHVDRPAAKLLGQAIEVRLHFGNRPVWQHMVFWAKGKLASFRDAQIADRESRID